MRLVSHLLAAVSISAALPAQSLLSEHDRLIPPTSALAVQSSLALATRTPSHQQARFAERATCDDRQLKSGKAKQGLGALVGTAGAVVTFFSFYGQTKTTYVLGVPQVEQSFNTPRLVIGLGALGYGAYEWFKGEEAIAHSRDDALRGLIIGTTTQVDAIACLGKPDATSTATASGGDTSVLTYRNSANGATQLFKLTFARGVLTNIERAFTTD